MAGGQGEGRDNEPGFAPAVFAAKPGVLGVACRQVERCKEASQEEGAKKAVFKTIS